MKNGQCGLLYKIVGENIIIPLNNRIILNKRIFYFIIKFNGTVKIK